jgi:hypothetical protein
VDPLAEKYSEISPYVYTLNNPLKYIDPNGNDVVPAIKGEKHAEALKRFLTTKEGYNFIAQYARSGQKILGYEFKSDGEFVDRNLWISSESINVRKGKAITYLSNAVGGRKRLRNILYPENDLPANGENYKFEHCIFLELNDKYSVEDFTYTLSHEAFVHIDNDANALKEIFGKLDAGEYTDNLSGFMKDLRAVDQDAKKEHDNLAKDLVTRLKNIVNELNKNGNTMYYIELYNRDKEIHSGND